MTEISEEFALLRAGSAVPRGTQLVTRKLEVNGHLCFIGLDSRGQKHLLVGIGEEHVAPDLASQGVTLTTRELLHAGEAVQLADLHCRMGALELVFERLADDVVQRLTAGARRPGATCVATLSDWRALLKGAGRPLSRDAVVGLAGELEVLGRLASTDPVDALESWQGPEGATHDFATGGRELEVKSTASVDGNFIQVSNLDQLDPTGLEDLHLVVVHFREHGRGETLDERIERLITAGVPSDRLLRATDRAGYVYESGADQGLRLAVRTVRVWRVGDGFPGLRRSELGTRIRGVGKVTYELALDSSGRPMGESDTADFLRTWGTGASD